jgi:DNA helicase-2/ATP-dependent DNA helicase PcrA
LPDLLDSLDVDQRSAAEALLGPVVILAGAGTGKTRTITHRIAHGVASGIYAANRVLALTYTNRAAGEIRLRLRQLGAGPVAVKTFHAAALGQLEYFWPQFAGVPAPMILSGKTAMLSSVSSQRGIDLDSPSLRDLASEIEWRKLSMMSLDKYAELSSRPQVAGLSHTKNVELQRAYEEAKIKAQKIDFEDVLILTLGLLRAEPRALEHVRQQYRFFTVDEYQDVSPLQHALLDEWLGERNDICVVGDPNQTIYSFTGATSDFLKGFSTRFDDATEIQLSRNYRSTKEVVNFANQLADGGLDALESQLDLGATPTIASYANDLEEAEATAKAVKRQLELGVPAHDVAILYRVNGQSEAFENALSKLHIEYSVRGGERFFNRTEIQQAMQGVRAEAVLSTDKSLRHSVTDICRSLGWQSKEPAEAGATRDRWFALSAFLGILDEMPDDATLVDFANELDERKRSQHEPLQSSVTLSTIHAVKGLEWPVVFVAGLSEGYLPISFAKTDFEIAEEQRLLYVAVTRAGKELQLSWAKRDELHARDRSPSRFLARFAKVG